MWCYKPGAEGTRRKKSRFWTGKKNNEEKEHTSGLLNKNPGRPGPDMGFPGRAGPVKTCFGLFRHSDNTPQKPPQMQSNIPINITLPTLAMPSANELPPQMSRTINFSSHFRKNKSKTIGTSVALASSAVESQPASQATKHQQTPKTLPSQFQFLTQELHEASNTARNRIQLGEHR